LGHLSATSSSGLYKSDPHAGHFFGSSISISIPFLLSSILFITSGITSPDLFTQTQSPIFIFFLFISSKLWSVARDTRTPLILTGSNIATGVTVPVLPTWNSTQSNLVVTSSAGNLYAIAHLGLFAFSPRVLLNLKSFTFITTPSDSKGNSLCFEYI
jgi:hypothetical protein